MILLDATRAAGILGLLRRQALGKTAVLAVWSSIKTCTWTLFRLNLLIGIIAVVVLGCIGWIMHLLGLGKTGLLIVVGFYLVFIKYALADPLVVVENMGARNALQRSWEMTKGYFWFVAGCYLFLGLGDWLINWTMALPLLGGADYGTNWVGVPGEFGLELIDSTWIILSWCMYLRIKEVEASPPLEPIPSN